jgi:nucleoprotein TPR
MIVLNWHVHLKAFELIE